jgi:ABC-type glycerol-3-phosphate transport system substrate-binding protein
MKTRTSLAFLAMALAMLLGACGGGGSGGGAATPPAVTPPPATMADAFYSAVLSLVGSSPEDKEPVAVEGIAPTAPDNTGPES